MVDWVKSTGSSGEMMIRDTGTVVEFWITAGNGTTFHHDLPWASVVNGSSSAWKEYNYNAGTGYERLGSWTVTTSQTVTFKLGSTGTGGFGGPTTFSHAIDRASPPDAPSVVKLTEIDSDSIRGTFTAGSNNGASITENIIGYGTNSTEPVSNVDVGTNRTHPFTGLNPGTTYYFWARTRNSEGYSPRGPRSSAKTLDVSDAPSAVTISNITQTAVDVAFTANANGGASVLEYQVAHGTSPTTPFTYTSTGLNKSLHITGLIPGTTYYFWTRARNAIGWSPLSGSRSAKTVAGARFKIDGVWEYAVPYVKVGGVWKVAIPWGRYAGIWKETSS